MTPSIRPYAPAADEALHALRRGHPDARPLVFLHGITGSRRYFEGRVMHMSQRYRLVIPDLLGFGLSPKPQVDYTVPLFADSVRRLLEKEGLAGRPHTLVGHSLGALVAIQYCIDHGQDVDALVLINLPRFNSPEEAHRLFWLGSPQYRKLLNEHSVAENLAQMKRTGVDLFLKYLVRFPWGVVADCRKFTMRSLTSTLENCLLNYRLDEVLPRMPDRPTLLIHGLRDGVAPYDNVKDLPRTHSYMTLETIAGSGHHVFLTHTRRCLQVIEAFLERTAAPARPDPSGRAAAGLPQRSL
ncbi:MAG: alpha/beta fold hydrolase [Candidatus Polarisedimenticolia bacterium]